MSSKRNPAPAQPDQLATLANRLSAADRALCRLLADHRVLTADHAAQLVYAQPATARHRLRDLHGLGVVDRFQPHAPVGTGSAPYCYVLGPLGAAVLAAGHGAEPAQLGYRRDQALAIAHNSPRLTHLLGVNSFFATLAATARAQPGTALVRWWPARRCADRWGQVVQPDGYGHWRQPDGEVDFFLEHPHDPQALGAVVAKLAGYDDLAIGSKIPTPILIWLPDPALEAAIHQALHSNPPLAPVATATPGAGAPHTAVWQPLGRLGTSRASLAGLARSSTWTARTPPRAGTAQTATPKRACERRDEPADEL